MDQTLYLALETERWRVPCQEASKLDRGQEGTLRMDKDMQGGGALGGRRGMCVFSRWVVSPLATPRTVASCSVHGISQVSILEWVAISFSRGSSWPCVSCIAGGFLTAWATRETQGNAEGGRVGEPRVLRRGWIPETGIGKSDQQPEGRQRHSGQRGQWTARWVGFVCAWRWGQAAECLGELRETGKR